MRISLDLMNSREVVEQTLKELVGFLEAAGFSEELIHDLQLISEELLVNAISYGYPDGRSGRLAITGEISEARKVRLVFCDDGDPFDLTTAQERDLDEERLGGWGLPMIKALSDRLEYRREAEQNILMVERGERETPEVLANG